jgi:hypothetical protein
MMRCLLFREDLVTPASLDKSRPVNAAITTRPARGQQQLHLNFTTKLGNSSAPWATDRAEEQTMEDVKPGKIVGRKERSGGCHTCTRVAPDTGGISARFGRSRAIRMT